MAVPVGRCCPAVTKSAGGSPLPFPRRPGRAAKVLDGMLDKLHSASARGHRVGLAVVRELSKKGGD